MKKTKPQLTSISIFLTVIITLLVAGTGVSHYLISNSNKDINNLELRITNLEEKQEAVYSALKGVGIKVKSTKLDIQKPSGKNDHWQGNKKSKFVWIVYTDLECPYCQEAHPLFKEIAQENEDNFALVFRHFPLESIHENAKDLAIASECVADKSGDDEFFKFIDDAFEQKITLGKMDSYLSQEEFKTCKEDVKIVSKVENNLNDAIKNGIRATPTSVLYHVKTGKTEVIEGLGSKIQTQEAIDKFVNKFK